jgi:hypothetical protein
MTLALTPIMTMSQDMNKFTYRIAGNQSHQTQNDHDHSNRQQHAILLVEPDSEAIDCDNSMRFSETTVTRMIIRIIPM